MASTVDPYKILGIAKDAPDEEVKKAYRSKATKYHPDAGGDAWVFQQVQEAYETILRERSPQSARPQKNASDRAARSDPSNRKTREPNGSGPDSGAKPGQQTGSRTGQQPDRGPSKAKPNPANSSSSSSRAPVHPPSGQANATEPVAETSPKPALLNIFFGQLPLQTETNVFILLNVADIFMTYALLRNGGIEANPIANYFFQRWNIQGMVAFKMVLVALVAVLAQWIARQNSRRASQVLNLGTIIVLVVVAYSALLLARKLS